MGGQNWFWTENQSTMEFHSSTTARLTLLSLCSGLLRRILLLLRLLRLLPRLRLRASRRKPNYSRTVHNISVRIEPRSVTRTIPRFFCVVPVDDAIEVGADG